MKYRVLKKITKDYDTKYTKETTTQEIHLTFGSCEIHISEQQYGITHSPHVHIVVPNCTYSISLKDLILSIYPNAAVTDNSLL